MAIDGRSLRDVVMSEGAVVLPFGDHPLTLKNLDLIDRITDFELNMAIYKHITKGDRGDRHDMWKLALRTDLEKIEDHNPEILDGVEPIIGSREMFDLYREIDPFARTLRKIQINLLQESGFVGPHIDRGSNPQWLMVCILQLSKQYDGGKYAIVHPDGRKEFPSQYGSLLIARTDVDHKIMPVTAGIRKTLAYFVGMDLTPNYNGSGLSKPGRY